VNVVNITNINNIQNDHRGFEPLRGGPRAASNVDGAFKNEHIRAGISSMRGDQFGRGRVPMQQQKFDSGSLRQASLMTGKNPVSPSHESFHSSDRQVNPGAIPNRANNNQHFFSSNARQSTAGQAERSQGTFNRGGSPSGAQTPQSAARPGFHGFGSNNPGNTNSGNQQGSFNSKGNQPQQNTARPDSNQSRQSFHSFDSNNPGNGNRGPVSGQGSNSPQQHVQSQQRSFIPPASQQQQSSRPAYRPFTPPSNQSQSNGGDRTYGGQSGGQLRPSYSPPPAQSPRQYQNNSRGSSSDSGYSRPSLNMQQPVVRPRGGSYSPAPAMRSAPSGGGYGGGGNRGGSPGGGPRGGNSGGGSHSAPPSSGGGHSSSGHDHR